ncbi:MULTISPECIES: amidohydrolase family protein [unclassified Mycolicibacterium]|uniref:amidohydrolase family protein n=1 Tax=unclassified Mycolicibacterium TaxID=2636767 RepID=UPI0012DF29AA|nr:MULTISPECIES: amidohydrolase family protein [unclassified Mycolicibacterium]MUL82486.1 amidohydrolase family protein [Mycolicibacterium sp. CBMA 329]MUL91382.1 amidohydrolase family protein [Mycolicibacterium sp. CBMA 331]MUM01505.1 amidohydrolase family protein [Mycolicibacterium sp. CBMA 334]MUM27432.1 amidohydrolase family protein [Mycolicibacterium sp. CBMA 295]MUM41806.1 amidohydrolase family protein [Mycolicibacterium sp. CBMA 247]
MTNLLMRNATLIDGTGADPVPAAAILIADGKISWAGPEAALRTEQTAGVSTVDVGGNTVCPGFFDCHVHFGLPGAKGSPLERVLKPPSYSYFQLIERLRVTLHNGVTTARDLMGIDVGIREAVADGLVAGPRLLVAINMLSQTSGHADFHLPSGIDLTPFVGGSLVDSVDAARTRTRELIRQGADVIKVGSSGGVSSPNDDPSWLGMRREMIAAIVEEGRNYGGRPVAAHAIGYAGIRAAVEAGVHSVEHGYELDDELRQQMVAQGTFLVPTLLETMTPVTASPQGAAKSAKWHAMAHDSIHASAAAGIKIAVGTDAGLSPDHGTNLKELGLLVKFGGLTPMQAIVAGTRTAAELCGVDESLGTVEPGKVADLVVVRGDPLTDIDSVGDPANILLVVKDGAAVSNRGEFTIP